MKSSKIDTSIPSVPCAAGQQQGQSIVDVCMNNGFWKRVNFKELSIQG